MKKGIPWLVGAGLLALGLALRQSLAAYQETAVQEMVRVELARVNRALQEYLQLREIPGTSGAGA